MSHTVATRTRVRSFALAAGAGLIALTLGACTAESETTADAGATPAAVVPVALPETPAVDHTRLTFDVEGMHCGNCAKRVNGVLAAIDGVAACDVSYDDGTAIVDVTNPAARAAVVAALEAENYTVSEAGPGTDAG